MKAAGFGLYNQPFASESCVSHSYCWRIFVVAQLVSLSQTIPLVSKYFGRTLGCNDLCGKRLHPTKIWFKLFCRFADTSNLCTFNE